MRFPSNTRVYPWVLFELPCTTASGDVAVARVYAVVRRSAQLSGSCIARGVHSFGGSCTAFSGLYNFSGSCTAFSGSCTAFQGAELFEMCTASGLYFSGRVYSSGRVGLFRESWGVGFRRTVTGCRHNSPEERGGGEQEARRIPSNSDRPEGTSLYCGRAGELGEILESWGARRDGGELGSSEGFRVTAFAEPRKRLGGRARELGGIPSNCLRSTTEETISAYEQ
jgi:hypothetical protein